MGVSVCVKLRQPMATTSCGWIRMTDDVRGVKAESIARITGRDWGHWVVYHVCYDTQSVGNEVTASFGRGE